MLRGYGGIYLGNATRVTRNRKSRVFGTFLSIWKPRCFGTRFRVFFLVLIFLNTYLTSNLSMQTVRRDLPPVFIPRTFPHCKGTAKQVYFYHSFLSTVNFIHFLFLTIHPSTCNKSKYYTWRAEICCFALVICMEYCIARVEFGFGTAIVCCWTRCCSTLICDKNNKKKSWIVETTYRVDSWILNAGHLSKD